MHTGSNTGRSKREGRERGQWIGWWTGQRFLDEEEEYSDSQA